MKILNTLSLSLLFSVTFGHAAPGDFTVSTSHHGISMMENNPAPLAKILRFSKVKVNQAQISRYLRVLPLQNPEQRYTLLDYQTPNRSQVGNDGLDTGACPTFAVIAAMEAFYKRQCMIQHSKINPASCDINLSEDYYIHLNSQISNLNNYARSENFSSFCGVTRGLRFDWGGPGGLASYWGKAIPLEIGSDGALASVTAKNNFAKKSDLYHICKETSSIPTQSSIDDYEYDYDHFSAALQKRTTHAILGYMSVSFKKSDAIERLIYNKHEIIAAHVWDHIVKDGTDANGIKIYKHDSSNGCDPLVKSCGGHAILIIGYDKVNQRYLAKNSYGSGSNYWISYYKDDGVTPILFGGQFITKVRDVNLGPQKDAQWIGKWNMDHDGWIGKLVIRRTKRSANEHNRYKGNDSIPLENISNLPRLGTYYKNFKRHPVYGKLRNDGQKLTLYVDFNTDNESYSDNLGDVTQSTQKFDFYLSGDGDTAAGVTYWGGKRFGSFLSRPYMAIEHNSGGNFTVNDWKATWVINIGGTLKGLLKITDISNNSIKGQFIYRGKSHQISGTIVSNYAMVRIDGINGITKYLNLFYHTKERGFLSGFTKSDEAIFATSSI